MKHARKDYDRIQAPTDLIPEDEPVFLLRAQDTIAPDVVNAWADLAEQSSAAPNIIEAARKQADAMVDWQKEHGSKIPDMP